MSKYVCHSLLVLAAVAVVVGVLGAGAAGGEVLPSGRVYELVSPPRDNGYGAGANGQGPPASPEAAPYYALASSEGNALVYGAFGPMGQTSYGLGVSYELSRRSESGWSATSALPASAPVSSALEDSIEAFEPSADLSHFLFASKLSFTSERPFNNAAAMGIYLGDEGESAKWIARPTISDPNPAAMAKSGENPPQPAGGSPNLDTAYFTYEGTLLPADEARSPYVNPNEGEAGPWGFYEWRNGTLSEAGVLPNGGVSPWGAVPAGEITGAGSGARGIYPQRFHNQVSEDGTRAFFVSPDPYGNATRLCEAVEPASKCRTQLYVRETASDGEQSTVLISKSGVTGEPSADGVETLEPSDISPSLVYASPDGSHAFFASVDALTSDAPTDGSVKVYDFDVDTGTLSYLPGVPAGNSGGIVAVSHDGSSFFFASKSAGLNLWRSGEITKITPLPELDEENPSRTFSYRLSEVRATADGSVIVFATNIAVPGGFNNLGGTQEIYRYDVAEGRLTCVSCAPAGVAPQGNAYLSDYEGLGLGASEVGALSANRAISSSGDRVFFDTPEALVPGDVNGVRDVYEWVADGTGACQDPSGCRYLISSGTASQNSYVLDNSASGSDVFFVTDDRLTPEDSTGNFSVYDARIGGGFPAPVAPAECSSDCQGSAGVAPAFAAPASATLSGAGNLAVPVTPALKAKVKKRPARCKRGFVRRKHRCVSKRNAKRSPGNRRNT